MRRSARASSTAVVVFVVAAFALAWSPRSALAQTSTVPAGETADSYAGKLYAAGMVAYDNGNYRQALDYFQQAHDLGGHADVLYDVGLTADRLQLDETALRAFELYLEKVPDAENRVEVEQRIAVLRQAIETKAAQRREASAADRSAAEAAVISPEDAARSARIAGKDSDATLYADDGVDRDDSVLTKWWLWTGVGVVVTATIVTVIAASSGTETRTRETFTGSSGKVIMTLGRAR